MRLLYLPGAIWAKSGCVALNKTTMLAVILARLRFNSTRSQIIAIGSQATGGRKSTKLQAPSSRESPSPKHQTALPVSSFLELGIWSFFGAWSLELGASAAAPRWRYPIPHASFGFAATLC